MQVFMAREVVEANKPDVEDTPHYLMQFIGDTSNPAGSYRHTHKLTRASETSLDVTRRTALSRSAERSRVEVAQLLLHQIPFADFS
jgi:hypothetical protein